MDNKQYQRAVTPTIEGGSSAVKGKILTYSNTITSQNGNSRSGVPQTTGRPPTNATAINYRPSSTVSPRISATQGAVAEMTIQGRNGTGMINTSAKIVSGANQPNAIADQPNSISILPRYDLVPVSDELPVDGIVFARVRNQPDNLVVFRTPDERLRNPERLNLDRRQLDSCPILEQEQRLRLLNYQNNMIKQISNLENLPNLIFLDLYNNQITSLEGPLVCVKGLRVLMAGKNKIQKICNLQSLKKLDVLDLHSNEIKIIEGLEGLADLRVLNLAGNRISIVNSLNSLTSLTELNLRRNKIQSVQGLDKLPALQRVFLSHNNIQSLHDVNCIFGIQYLIELSLDGNPVADSDAAKYRQYIIATIPTLKHLDLKRINEEERHATTESPPMFESNKSIQIGTIPLERNENPDGINEDFEGNTIKQEALRIESLDADCEHAIEPKPECVQQDDREPTLITKDINGKDKDMQVEMETQTQSYSIQQQIGQFTSGISQMSPSASNGVESIASLARNGRLAKMQSLFDIEVLGPDEKVMVIVGEGWDWNAPKRLLSAVTETCLLYVRRECLVSKFNSTHMQSLSSLRTMRFLYNDFSSLKQVEFIPAMYGSNLHHLYILENPVNQSASAILRAYMVALIPKLQSFNGITISPIERNAAEKAYLPFVNVKAKSVKLFTSASMKLIKHSGSAGNIDQSNSELSSPKNKRVSNSVGHQHIQLYSDLHKHQIQTLGFEDFSKEYDNVIKEIITNVITGVRSHSHVR